MRNLPNLVFTAVIAVALTAAGRADTAYPTRPIQIVVPVPPGGAADFIARTIGVRLGEALGQSVIVNNQGGAGGTIATRAVAKVDPDGYTLLLNSITTHGIGPHLYNALPYDPARDFAPVILLARLPLIMTVNSSVPATSVQELTALAKAQPGQLAFASSGNGGAPHLAGELFKGITGTDLLHVPYRGSGPAVIDVVAGRIAIMFDAAPALLPHVMAGKLRPLAAASAARHPLLPEIPTFGELGLHGMDISLWYGIAAPAGCSPLILQRLNTELVKILSMPEIRASFSRQGANPAGGTAEDFGAFMREEAARWGTVVKQAGIKPE